MLMPAMRTFNWWCVSGSKLEVLLNTFIAPSVLTDNGWFCGISITTRDIFTYFGNAYIHCILVFNIFFPKDIQAQWQSRYHIYLLTLSNCMFCILFHFISLRSIREHWWGKVFGLLWINSILSCWLISFSDPLLQVQLGRLTENSAEGQYILTFYLINCDIGMHWQV